MKFQVFQFELLKFFTCGASCLKERKNNTDWMHALLLLSKQVKILMENEDTYCCPLETLTLSTDKLVPVGVQYIIFIDYLDTLDFAFVLDKSR